MKQNKPVIGIIPYIRWDETENPYKDRYEFVKFFSQKLYAANAIPLGILLDDKKVNKDILEFCDAFIYPGGNKIEKKLYEILFHAYLYKKPVLGVCMGMQAMCIFSVMLEEIKKRKLDYSHITSQMWLDIYHEMIESNPTLSKLPDDTFHNGEITRTSYEQALYPINIIPGSFLNTVYGNHANVLHMHSVEAKRTGMLLKPVAYSEDHVIEAVESTENDLFWLGVQFHPEALPDDTLITNWVKKLTK